MTDERPKPIVLTEEEFVTACFRCWNAKLKFCHDRIRRQYPKLFEDA